MSAPTNISATTATDLGTLPNAITEPVSFSGTTYTVWFKHTATDNLPAFGVFAKADPFGSGTYIPQLSAFIGPATAPVAYPVSNPIVSVQEPVIVPSRNGVTYFFKVENTGSDNISNTLLISGTPGPTDPATLGSLLVIEDDDDWPARIQSSSDGSILQFSPITTGSENGAINPSGIFAIYNGTSQTIDLYNPDQTPITSIPSVLDTVQIASDGGSTFWAASVTAPSILSSFDEAGVVSPTTYTLPTNANNLSSIFVNQAGTILYYTEQTTNKAIHRYDLVGLAPLSDLAAGIASNFNNIIGLSDGTTLAVWYRTGVQIIVRHYSTAPALITDYGTLATTSFDDIALGADDPLSFWLRYDSANVSTCRHYHVSDGSVIGTVTGDIFVSGIRQATATEFPDAFGPPLSCPLLVLRRSVGPPTPPFTTITYPVRRVRQSPHLSNLQLQQFFSMFQLDIEAGRGLVDGSDPQIMLSFSDDGGHTWSQEHWVGAGKIGEFKRRAIWRRLGKSRDRVWKIVVDAPIPWRILQAFTAVEEGTS